MAIKPKSMLPRISLWFSSNADVFVTLSMSSKLSFKHVDAGGEKNACAGALGSGGLIQLWLITGGLILDLHSERGNKCTLLKPQPSIASPLLWSLLEEHRLSETSETKKAADTLLLWNKTTDKEGKETALLPNKSNEECSSRGVCHQIENWIHHWEKYTNWTAVYNITPQTLQNMNPTTCKNN